MRLPEGQLIRARVVADPRTVLVDALDRELTGYAVLDPQETLLFDAAGSGVVTFRDGVPVVAYHTGTERGGPPALADLAADGPYRLELVATAPDALACVHALERYRVPPAMPAERLAGDRDLADRTRAAAPANRDCPARETTDPGTVGSGVGGAGDGSGADGAGCTGGVGDGTADAASTADSAAAEERQPGAVEAFLENEEKIEALREAAREEAHERAEEWGFDV